MQCTFKHLKKVCFINLLFVILFLTLGQASSAELKKGTGTFLIETAIKTAELKKGTGTFLIETAIKTADSKFKSLKVASPEVTFISSIHTDTVKNPYRHCYRFEVGGLYCWGRRGTFVTLANAGVHS